MGGRQARKGLQPERRLEQARRLNEKAANGEGRGTALRFPALRPRSSRSRDPPSLVALAQELGLGPWDTVPARLDRLLEVDEQVIALAEDFAERVCALAREVHLGLEDGLERHAQRPRLEFVEQRLLVVVADEPVALLPAP